jgi:hypothetical protein
MRARLIDPPHATVQAMNRQLTNSAHRIIDTVLLRINHPAKRIFLSGQEPEHDKDWECDEHVSRNTHQRNIRSPEECGRHDAQQAVDGQRQGQLSHPCEQYDYGEDEKCQVVE